VKGAQVDLASGFAGIRTKVRSQRKERGEKGGGGRVNIKDYSRKKRREEFSEGSGPEKTRDAHKKKKKNTKRGGLRERLTHTGTKIKSPGGKI